MAKKNKPRASGTLTEAQFWGMIRSSLRKQSRWWKPILICRDNAKRKYEGANKRQKWEYQCNICKGWFPAKQTNVDHILPVGKLSSAQDLPCFVERLFCELDNLQLVCSKCHDIKTKKENNKNG